jgi:TrpR-related protein YerC/YecD
MKRKSIEPDDGLDPVRALCRAFAALETPAEVRAFLDDLCTPAEIEAMADRWRVVPWLLEATPYREIHDHTGVSVTTIGRVARCLESGAGGYRIAAERALARRRGRGGGRVGRARKAGRGGGDERA